MEFWGAEVKHGETLKVSPGEGRVLHLSQANVGELKKGKGNESVCLFLTVDGKKLVLGTIYTERIPQQQFELVFEKDFELSHNWKSGSVFFYGYKADNGVQEDFDDTVASSDGESDSSESEEDIPLVLGNSGNHESKAKDQKPAEAAKEKKSDAGKQKLLPYDHLFVRSDDESNTEDEADSDAESDESEEETPKKAETSKKRPIESASKTPVAQKKAKVTPHSTDGKKGSVHVDTPYPSRPIGNKAPFAEKKVSKQSAKSGGSHPCTSCDRAFVNDKALESHSKAKHSGGK